MNKVHQHSLLNDTKLLPSHHILSTNSTFCVVVFVQSCLLAPPLIRGYYTCNIISLLQIFLTLKPTWRTMVVFSDLRLDVLAPNNFFPIFFRTRMTELTVTNEKLKPLSPVSRILSQREKIGFHCDASIYLFRVRKIQAEALLVSNKRITPDGQYTLSVLFFYGVYSFPTCR